MSPVAWLPAPPAARKPTHVPGPCAPGRTPAAAPLGGCWPGTNTSTAPSFASTSCDTTCCWVLSAQACATHWATTFGGLLLLPTCWTPAGGCEAQAEIAMVNASRGAYFTCSP